MGLMAVVSLWLTDLQVPPARRVDFSAAGTWLFIAGHLGSALAGAWVMRCRPASGP